MATLVLVGLTGYYAWASRMLVRETRATLQAAARATLQERLDRISEIFIREPGLSNGLNDDFPTTGEWDARFHVTNIFLGILEEAYTQYALDHAMTADDWSAWEATADTFLQRKYIQGYWTQAQRTYEPSFRRFIDARLAAQVANP